MSNLIHPDDCTDLLALLHDGKIAIESEMGKTHITKNPDDLKSERPIYFASYEGELNTNTASELLIMKYCFCCGKQLLKQTT